MSENNLTISEWRVLQSAAGFYIGHICWELHEAMGAVYEPYDRQSEYMTKEMATKELPYYILAECETEEEIKAVQEYYKFKR